jgi:hypothetical protein
MFVFEATTIKPLADLIADALTNQLARDFDPRLVVRFEDFITEDKSFALEKRKALLDRKVITVNEVRLEDGREPVEWGDLPISTSQEIPYTGDPPPEEAPAAPARQPEPRDAAEDEE